MACPHCGGTDRRAISAGFWECTSMLYGEIPTGLHPSGKFGPAFQTVAHPCGRRYQEGAPGGTGMLCQTCTVFRDRHLRRLRKPAMRKLRTPLPRRVPVR